MRVYAAGIYGSVTAIGTWFKDHNRAIQDQEAYMRMRDQMMRSREANLEPACLLMQDEEGSIVVVGPGRQPWLEGGEEASYRVQVIQQGSRWGDVVVRAKSRYEAQQEALATPEDEFISWSETQFDLPYSGVEGIHRLGETS